MPYEMTLDTDNMAERVQRAMIESSLAQGAGAYSSSKKRSAMDELYMDLKGLQLAKPGMSSELAYKSGIHQQQAFNWEQAHLEWERAQQMPAARAAASRSNSSGLPEGNKQASLAARSARSASSTSSCSMQQWSGMAASSTVVTKAGPLQRHSHLPPTVPKPAAHFSLPPPQPPQTQASGENQTVPSSSSACDEGDQVEAAGPSASSSRWDAFQAKTKAALQKVHISRSGSMGQQQQKENHGGEGVSQPVTEHAQAESQPDDDPDVLPHHRRHCSHHRSLGQHSPSSSFSSRTSASARAPRGLSSSLALPSPARGTEQGGVLGKESFIRAMELFFGERLQDK
ncbi:hypothetical protein DUNSADRAFT_14703 [Dunaliella salina]|uniref:Uncharacterized protein n=1 Tax=Dunaliella salina TaxID=3046 RepID=A0ABQ7G6Y7_DUNSA|nr:hypothetical protein DUNSADRAFT_14703 [Dunaliella salina]KAF5830340.1 hypothetical protein DUNSADRAFT_14703 [Dunaliella salina]|eukprot:KAF5830339.1 hypothetical protein DUNSADRAFT_14703 [Dunaliella salina]